MTATREYRTGVKVEPAQQEQRCRGPCSAGGLDLLPPEPIRELAPESNLTLSPAHEASVSGSLLRHKRKREPPTVLRIGPRSTSRYQTTGTARPAAIRPLPDLKFEDVDLADGEKDEAQNLLDRHESMALTPRPGHAPRFSQMFGVSSRPGSGDCAQPCMLSSGKINLNGVRHVDLADPADEVLLHQTCSHAPVARNWPTDRKRFAALVSCINTACVGLLLGIYSGEVPAIQYVVVDLHRTMIYGNVFLYCGLVLPTLVFWPLPLLHGRKPYTVVALALALCLQIPQGLTVITWRSPDVSRYRIVLLLSRGMSGVVLGFVNINNLGTLLDVFGASLQSSPWGDDAANPLDIRRHGGGIGVWLAVWSWCTTGSIGLGFLVGASIVSGTSADWGFWVSLLLLLAVLLLNVLAPEVRRSAFRRTIAEVLGEGGLTSRAARGEVKMHLTGNGPYWWGEEVKAGLELSRRMVSQPGFLVLSIYSAWVYAQFTLVLMLLGALVSTKYRARPVDVGLSVLAMAVGAAVAVPFEKASWLSRARYRPPRTDSMTLRKSGVWTSHSVRRSASMVLLPLAAIGYALTCRGPVLPVAVPCVFAGLVGYCTTLVVGESYALILQTFDTSDLQPGMTGRLPRRSAVRRYGGQRTNFSCYPRVSAGIAVTQSLKFAFGAVSTGICGRVERRYGAMQAAAIVAGVLLCLTTLATGVLFRWHQVQLVPDGAGGRPADDGWEPVILGHPSGLTRKISILESGDLTRWTEIRRRNHLATRLTGGPWLAVRGGEPRER